MLAMSVSVVLAGCAVQVEPAPRSAGLSDPGLAAAARNYPPLIIGANTEAVSGPVFVRACPAAGGRVEQKGGPTFEYLGASPTQAELCRIRVGGETVEGWYGIWLTAWPGHEQGRAALARVMQAGAGAVEGFDVRMAPGFFFHDLVRNEGVESIALLGRTYRALKISHYREGFDGNIYRSLSTIWKDVATGLLIYGTYQHISGAPELDDPLIPTRIMTAF